MAGLGPVQYLEARNWADIINIDVHYIKSRINPEASLGGRRGADFLWVVVASLMQPNRLPSAATRL